MNADTLPEGLPSNFDASPSELGPESLGGLPMDRAARIAARRAFVEMKHLFMTAAETLNDRKGAWLRQQVRLAHDPIDLWLLRGPLLAALRQGDEATTRKLRAALYRQLDCTFPETFGLGHGQTLPHLPEPWEIWAAGGQHPALNR